MMQGYSLLEKQCSNCSMPLTEYKGIIDCVVCPALEKKVEKVKHKRDKCERERVRVMLETQLLQQRKLSHAKKNRFIEKTRHLNQVSAHLMGLEAVPATNLDISGCPDTPQVPREEEVQAKSITNVLTCQTGSSTVLDSPQAEFSTHQESVRDDKKSTSKEPAIKEEEISSQEESGIYTVKGEGSIKLKIVDTKSAVDKTSSLDIETRSLPPKLPASAQSTKSIADKVSSLDIETRSLPTKPLTSALSPNGTSSVEMRTSKTTGAVEVELKDEDAKISDLKKNMPPQSSKPEYINPISKCSPAKRSSDRCRPVRPVMGIVKVTPQPGSQPRSQSVSLTRNSEPNLNTGMSLRSDKPQPETAKSPTTTDSLSKSSRASEKISDCTASNSSQHDSQMMDKCTVSNTPGSGLQASVNPGSGCLETEQKNADGEEESPAVHVEADASRDDSTKVSSLHSDSTISTKSLTFRKRITPLQFPAKERSVHSIAEDRVMVALQESSVESGLRLSREAKMVPAVEEAPETKESANTGSSSAKSFTDEENSSSVRTQQSSKSTTVQEEATSNKSSKSSNSPKSKQSSASKLYQSPRSTPLEETVSVQHNKSSDVVTHEDEADTHVVAHSRDLATIPTTDRPNMADEKENAERSSIIPQSASLQKRDPSADPPAIIETNQESTPRGGAGVSQNATSVVSVKSTATQKSETDSEISRRKHWDLLRSESRAFLARRCILGWKLVSDTCKGRECGGIQLVAKGKATECVICGGTGTGNDGVYALLPPDIVEEHIMEDPSDEAVSNLDEDFLLDIPRIFGNRGIEEISIAKSSVNALSPTVMSLVATDMRPHTGVSMSQLHRDFESKRSAVSQQIAVKMSQGWSLLNLTCPLCVMPLMTDEEGQVEVCLLCGVVGTIHSGASAAGVRSVATAVTDASSVKSKDSTDDEEASLSLTFKCSRDTNDKSPDTTAEASGSMASAESGIKDRIVRSRIQARFGSSPRGDPPAVHGYNAAHRRHQVEAEESRMEWISVSGESNDNNIKIDPEESDRISTHTPSVPELEETDIEQHDNKSKKSEDAIILVEDASEEGLDSQPDEFVPTKTDRIMSTRQTESQEQDEGSELFAVALPKGFYVGEGHAVTDIINAAKSSDSLLRVNSLVSPSIDSAAYRLPSPGMTEASLPKMSPGSRRASPGSSQQTRQWGSSNQTKQRFPIPTHVKGRHNRQPSQDSQASFGSTGSSRRRVTPECPAGRPRYARLTALSTPAKTHPVKAMSRVSPTDSPILQTVTPRPPHRKQPLRAPTSASVSVASSSSSASSSLVLRVPVNKPKSGASITSVSDSPDFLSCDDPLDDMMDVASTFSGATRSVTSEAIDQLLARIEDTQVELVAAEKEEDGIYKQERLKELLNRLAIAAAAIQELDNGSQFA
eukprot:scaffold3973_cov161-Amphora_coffeaeformis.AAC.3